MTCIFCRASCFACFIKKICFDHPLYLQKPSLRGGGGLTDKYEGYSGRPHRILSNSAWRSLRSPRGLRKGCAPTKASNTTHPRDHKSTRVSCPLGETAQRAQRKEAESKWGKAGGLGGGRRLREPSLGLLHRLGPLGSFFVLLHFAHVGESYNIHALPLV